MRRLKEAASQRKRLYYQYHRPADSTSTLEPLSTTAQALPELPSKLSARPILYLSVRPSQLAHDL